MPAYEQYGMFDSTEDDVREYAAARFAEYFALVLRSGIFKGGTALQVYADGTEQAVRVRTGYAWIKGYMYALKLEQPTDTDYMLEIAAADGANDRVDTIVLRLDTSAKVRSIQLKVLTGKAAPSPAAPDPVRSGDIYDLVLAHVLVTANTSVLQASSVTDKRLVPGLCGLVNSLITADAAPAVHTHAASDIKAGTLGGKVVANTTAAAALAEAQVRNIKAQTVNLTAGTSPLANGEVVLVYE